DVDFGYAPPQCSVGDRVWLDEDRDGVQDVGEDGIAGATVVLFNSAGATVATATTDANGQYLFERLEAGSYSVTVSGAPSGSVQTFDLDGVSSASKASFSLSAGDDRRDVDFGYAPPFASVGDRVWLDADRDGVQDDDEAGIPGVEVKLLNGAGAIAATATTDASGLYLFDQLEAGSYTVSIPAAPAGLTQTFDLDGLSTANKASVNLSAGDAARDVDFGYATPPSTTTASVGDRVWKDTNLNGEQDSGEPGIAGVTVRLKSGYTTLATTTTNANGEYLFSGLSAGGYTVYVSGIPTGLNQTFDLDGNSSAYRAAFSLSLGQAKRDVDFGYGSLGCLGDRVWLDRDLDGVQDYNEGGLDCVTVKLYTSSGSYLRSTSTSSSGYYKFDDLPAGTYKVAVSGVSSGLSATFDPDGVSTAHQATVTLSAGQCRSDVDFGYGPAGSAGDRVWKDTDGDGCQDSGEIGISGVTVKLLNSNGSVLTTATTDSNGYYLFEKLAPAAYSVVVSNLPAGYTPTFDPDGTSTPHKVSGPLGSGENRRDVDFGYKPAAAMGSIGDRVWFDCDLDGVQDSNENGLGCVTVKLLNSNGSVIATTSTNSSGSYLFRDLPAGNYSVVVFDVSSGLAPSHDLDGAGTASKAEVSLTGGQNRRDVDFGYGPSCTVGNRVWKDTDGDRSQDRGEDGISGLTVKLLNSHGGVLQTTTTDGNGYYRFSGVAPGSYGISVSGLPSGYTQTYDLDGTSSAHRASFSLSCGDDRTDVDFGYRSTSSSGGSCSNSRCDRERCDRSHGDSRECDQRWCDRSRCSKSHQEGTKYGCTSSRCDRDRCDRSHGDNRPCESRWCDHDRCERRHCD
ncbi:MAG: SdrD B-like domain-containing protein, partial [Actinomycetota bacterium]